ncbi:hypothetical protein DIS13_09900 [Weissella paramesenteroides]|uniref:hypothetical protein n=1 Tax=Weissella paramesenteroides TaxID=1249 RepID=UPI00112AEF23|nr:hypothetical protein [Weissella paramesenteroides]TOY71308.1 hypothetical protein DIS13_09900 [Weissella paramesenteroides]
MTNFDEYMTNDNLALQAIIRYDDGREIRVFNVRDKLCCVFIQNDQEHFWLLREHILEPPMLSNITEAMHKAGIYDNYYHLSIEVFCGTDSKVYYPE